MHALTDHPAFAAYAVSALILCANLLFLWGLSGATRGKAKCTPNEEDAVRFGSKLAEIDPPSVARVLRAHRNAEAIIYPFLVIAGLYVLVGGSANGAVWFFGIFTITRLLHSFAYVKHLQPWRTISFAISGLTAIALMLDVAWILVSAA